MIRISLLPYRAQRWRLALLKHVVVVAAVLLAVLLLIAGVHMVTSGHLDGLTAQKSALEKENLRLRKKIGQIRNIDKLRENVEGKLAVVDKLQVGRFRSLSAMLALSAAIPENIWLKSMKDTGKGLRVSGYGESSNAVANFMRSLDRAPRFSGVKLGEIRRSKSGGVTVRKFSLTMDVVALTPEPVKKKKHRRRKR
ncbi:MAG: PilN domain-containing protein [Mariprofundales bacterium]